MKLTAKAAFAAEIAKIDKQRLNEAIAEGFYLCAPATKRGATRAFDVPDIITLIVYRHLTDEGMVPRCAGPVACGLRELLSRAPDAQTVYHVKDGLGQTEWLTDTEFSPSQASVWETNIVSARQWRLDLMRQFVMHKLNEEFEEREIALGGDE